MRMESKTWSKRGQELPIYLLLLGMLMIQLATPIEQLRVASLGVWIIVLASILAFLKLILVEKNQGLYVALLALLAVFLAMSVLLLPKFGYGEIVAIGCFLEIPFFVGAYEKLDSRDIKNAIYGTHMLLSWGYIALSFSELAYIYEAEYGVDQIDALTLGYHNPNATAMYLLECMIVLTSLLFYTRGKVKKILVLADILYIFYLIFQSRSRTGILLSLLFVAGVVIFKRRKITDTIRRIVVLFPCISFIIIEFWGGISDMLLLGEALDTGRKTIYDRALSSMNMSKFFFGDFSWGFQNLHNGYLAVFATIGLVGIICFFALLLPKIKKMHRRMYLFSGDFIALIGFFVMFLTLTTEAALITAGSVYGGMFLSLYLLCVTSNGGNCDEDITN